MHSTSVSLLRRLQTDDAEQSWNRFVQLYTPLLYYWAKRIGLPPADAEDFVQDVLVILLEKLPTFEHRGPGSFRGWLRTVAVNRFRERLRRQPPPAGSGDVNAIAGAAESDPFWEQEYRQRLVARALEVMQAEFQPLTWQACWEYVVEDRPAAEVARQLGMSEANVYVYAGRVLRRLRIELQDLWD